MSPIEKRISDIVKNSDLSHSEIARRTGISRSAVGRWEKDGKISVDNLPKLCSVLGVDIQYVIFGGSLSEEILPLQLKILNAIFTVTDIDKLKRVFKLLTDK